MKYIALIPILAIWLLGAVSAFIVSPFMAGFDVGSKWYTKFIEQIEK